MSLSDVKTKWMYIGTSDKEVNYRSEKGRIKTGEKGIGREQNPALYDMANREGLTQNDEYHIFVDILQEAIHVFETDRQGFYREYMRWHDEIEKTFGVDANIRADAVANMEVTGRTKSYENSPANDFKEEDEGNSNGYNGTIMRLIPFKFMEKSIQNQTRRTEHLKNLFGIQHFLHFHH